MMTSVIDALRQGKRGEVGNAPSIAKRCLHDPELLNDVAAIMKLDDPLLEARGARIFRDVAEAQAALLIPWREFILNDMRQMETWEARHHWCQTVVHLQLSEPEAEATFERFEQLLSDKKSIVKTCALQGMADLAIADSRLMARAEAHILRWTDEGTPAMRARGRKLLKKLG